MKLKSNTKLKASHLLALVSGVALSASQASSFNIDFIGDSWDYSDGSSSTGWDSAYSSGTSVFGYAGGVSVTVTSTFTGTAMAGASNFTEDPVLTNGFAFQNDSATDMNGSSIQNAQVLTFVFSESVLVDEFVVNDIDTQGSSSGGWADAVSVTFDGAAADVSLESSTNLVVSGDTVMASTLGNIANDSPLSQASFSTADAFTTMELTFWNGSGSTFQGDHAVSIGASLFTVAPIPEPTSAALLGLGGLALIARRRR